jgi:pimeloyl-ACP methyl ester carboxylesterase
MRIAVVLVHGLWMRGWEMALLRHRLRECGLECHRFRYASLRRTPAANARRLHAYLQGLDAEVIHLVGHSLGGIVLAHLFDLEPLQRPGRVLMLGTPLAGSVVARRIYAYPLLRPLLGRSTQRGVLGDAPAWKGGRALGMIAGTRGVGVGAALVGGLERPHDGVVALSETRSPGVCVHLQVPYSHLGMLFAAPVAEAVCRFLRDGEF